MFSKTPLIFVLWLASISLFSQNIDQFKVVNSVVDEQNPVLSPDGRTLYFTRSKFSKNVGGVNDPGDIWYSSKMPDGKWSEPINAIALNNSDWNGVLGFVGGSDVVYLLGHYESKNTKVKTQGISRSLKTTSGWSFPENINVPYFKNSSEYHGGSILFDASVMLLCLESYGTVGGEDIYISFNKGNSQWSEPKNLGSEINTKYQEFSPFITDDGQTLYFSSNGRSTSGGTDIFYSKRLDDTWLNWSNPQPVDKLNSEGKELGLHVYGNLYLYTSTLNSDGYGDIRAFIDPDMIEEVLEKDTTVQVVNGNQVVKIIEEEPVLDDRQITLFGSTIDQTTREAISVKISIKSVSDSLINLVRSQKGGYAIKIEAIGKYIIRAEATGYLSHQETLELKSDEIKNHELNFELQPITVGATVNLKDVLFKQSKAEFLESSYSELNLVVEFMKENPNVEIRLEGHTDNRGIAKYNLKLSKDRVNTVKNYLVKHGISKKRIDGKGFGGSRPIASNDDPESRVLNRRVEFTIVKN
jgi:OOP family OmpA-OmpF porin